MKTKLHRFGAGMLVLGVMAAGAGCGTAAEPTGDGPHADVRATSRAPSPIS
jgi:hypothetical protein